MLPDDVMSSEDVAALFSRLRCSKYVEGQLEDVLQAFTHYEITYQKTIELVDRLRQSHAAGEGPWLFEAEEAFMRVNGFPSAVADEDGFREARVTS